ncbi:LuxR C-terminal-related transcriptional regulator [Microbacterium sp. H83]|uniref:LuxR C-terminal-related transcriptional regulator n=1 Tax=Microbacterium sp. H83 TaxID=1827324 RepID=UPI00082A9803|nr:response regulator transcription factor [Microbacterium sp. H83]
MGSAAGPIVRVGIVDDQRIIVLGTTAVINDQPRLHVVAVGSTVSELLALQQCVDVVLLDLTLRDGSSISQNVADLAHAGARVLAFMSDESAGLLRLASRAGAIGQVWKFADPREIAATIRTAARRRAVDDGADAASAEGGDGSDAADARVELTTRETEVLALYAAGLTAEAVARRLSIARATVLDHVRRVRRKYAAAGRPARTKVDLFKRAIEDGVVDSDD